MATTKKPVTKKKTNEGGSNLSVYDLSGRQVKTVPASEALFGQNVNKAVLATYAKVYLTNQRQGTASTKTRSYVTMTSKKMYRQKGTGRARHGAANAPLFVGGGVAFGPLPKEYSKNLNKKQKRIAIVSALSDAHNRGAVAALDESIAAMKPNTASVAAMLRVLEAPKRILFILPKIEKAGLVLSARNIPNVVIMDAKSINAYEVMRAKHILFVESALSIAEAHFSKKDDESAKVEAKPVKTAVSS